MDKVVVHMLYDTETNPDELVAQTHTVPADLEPGMYRRWVARQRQLGAEITIKEPIVPGQTRRVFARFSPHRVHSYYTYTA